MRKILAQVNIHFYPLLLIFYIVYNFDLHRQKVWNS